MYFYIYFSVILQGEPIETMSHFSMVKGTDKDNTFYKDEKKQINENNYISVYMHSASIKITTVLRNLFPILCA